MKRRIELRETVIAPGAIIRLKKEFAPTIKDLMGRWRVLSKIEESVHVEDTEDADDTRTFALSVVERVSGGAEEVVGYTWIEEEDPLVAEASLYGDEDCYGDDPYDDSDTEVGYPSLFDDPIKLQAEEDGDDEDATEVVDLDCERVG